MALLPPKPEKSIARWKLPTRNSESSAARGFAAPRITLFFLTLLLLRASVGERSPRQPLPPVHIYPRQISLNAGRAGFEFETVAKMLRPVRSSPFFCASLTGRIIVSLSLFSPLPPPYSTSGSDNSASTTAPSTAKPLDRQDIYPGRLSITHARGSFCTYSLDEARLQTSAGRQRAIHARRQFSTSAMHHLRK